MHDVVFQPAGSKGLGIPHVAVNSQEFFLSSPLPKGQPCPPRQRRWLDWEVDLHVGKILVEKRPKSTAFATVW